MDGASGVSGTDWAAISAMTGVMALVVGLVTGWVNRRADQQRRTEDARQRRRERQVDRAERKRLLAAEHAARRCERLVRNYGLWYRALTNTVLNKERLALADEAAQEADGAAEDRRREVEERMKSLHTSLHGEARGYMAQTHRDTAEYFGEVADAQLLLINGTTELAATAMLIQVDETAERSAEVEALTGAIASPHRLSVKESERLIHQAGVLIDGRIKALREESAKMR